MRRFRRLRSNESIRSLVRETRVDKKDLIYPIFVAEGENIKSPWNLCQMFISIHLTD